MEQHPIPQQIASYQFKLVGDMTLKQFTQLAGGALISFLIYSTPLHPFIKWPLILISFLFGVALAFMPIQDRPLSTWIFAFLKSIYSPTYFVWNKAKKPIDYFSPEETVAKPASVKIAEKKEEVAELLRPVVKETESTTKLEEKEKSFLTKVSQSFIAPNTTVVISTTPIHTYAQSPPPTSQINISDSKALPLKPQATVQTSKRPDVAVPQQNTAGVDKLTGYKMQQTTASPAQPSASTSGVIPFTYEKTNVEKTATSQFSKDAVPPLPSPRENVVVGQVFDKFGQIVEGAILEIKDTDGRPVRALKSNKLGHFMIATPLISGEYIIQTEKDGYQFEPIKFRAEDKIISPIAVWAASGGEKKVDPMSNMSNEDKEFIKDFNL